MNYEELVENQHAANKAVSDSDFSKCINCDGEHYISLTMRHGQDFILSMSNSGLIVTNDQLKELRDVLNELFPIK